MNRVAAFYDARYVTGRFGDPRPNGRFHEGTDLSHSRTPGLTPVPALLGGQVVNIWAPSTGHGYGHRVDIATSKGVVSYAHLHSRTPLWLGQYIAQGDTVGHEGTSGFVSGPCVHSEHAVNGRKRDPLPLIRDVLATFSGGGHVPFPTVLKEDEPMLMLKIVAGKRTHLAALGPEVFKHFVPEEPYEKIMRVSRAGDDWQTIDISELGHFLATYGCDRNIWDLRDGNGTSVVLDHPDARFVVLDPLTGRVASGNTWTAAGAIRAALKAA